MRRDLLTRGAATVTVHVMDLDDTDAHEVVRSFDSIDVALLAHGVLGDQDAAQADFAACAAILHTNLLFAVSLITWLAHCFEREHKGTLAVISSVAGDRGRKSNYVYGASKGALNIFLDGVRNRVDDAGVHVLTIRPGFVRASALRVGPGRGCTMVTDFAPMEPQFAGALAIRHHGWKIRWITESTHSNAVDSQ